MLYEAFVELLGEKSFEDITVADITKRSTLHRATFYGHFTDKFALLESMIIDDFQVVLDSRMAGASPCQEGLRRMVMAVCDFFLKLRSGCQEHQKQFQPIAEAKTREMVGGFLLGAMAKHGVTGKDAALRATMASWAICGAALEWAQNPEGTTEELADAVIPRVDFVLWGQGACPTVVVAAVH
jgi:AcrR family transcriptional regulator